MNSATARRSAASSFWTLLTKINSFTRVEMVTHIPAVVTGVRHSPLPPCQMKTTTRPGFLAIVIFTVVNAVLIRPLPYPQPERLVAVWNRAPGMHLDQFEHSEGSYLVYRRHNHVLEDLGIYGEGSVTPAGGGRAHRPGRFAPRRRPPLSERERRPRPAWRHSGTGARGGGSAPVGRGGQVSEGPRPEVLGNLELELAVVDARHVDAFPQDLFPHPFGSVDGGQDAVDLLVRVLGEELPEIAEHLLHLLDGVDSEMALHLDDIGCADRGVGVGQHVELHGAAIPPALHVGGDEVHVEPLRQDLLHGRERQALGKAAELLSQAADLLPELAQLPVGLLAPLFVFLRHRGHDVPEVLIGHDVEVLPERSHFYQADIVSRNAAG